MTVDKGTRPSARRRPYASGRFVLRIAPALHDALRVAARDAGISLNDYCARKLAAPTDCLVQAGAGEAVSHAVSLFGADCVGLAVFGSWARGDATPGSDVDLLVVVESRVPVTRDLYRRWDTAPVQWEARVVEPHFVHLPEPGAVAGGVWAEVAMDGIVLFEHRWRLSRHLTSVRADIVSGRLVRRMVHGQPYWAEVA